MSIEDKLEIYDLNFRYAILVDSYKIDEWVQVFTPNAFFDESEFGFGAHEGHDNIRAYGQVLVETTTFMTHLMGNHLIERIDGNSAQGVVFSLIEVQTTDGTRTRYQVKYEDEYKKVGGKWLIDRRILRKTFEPEVV